MKKLLLIICIMFSITLNAQTKFYFGPKVGYKSNNLTLDDFTHSNVKGNLTLGAFGRIMFDNFIIQPELMYNHTTFTEYGCAHPITLCKVRNHSFALPIYFGYQFINKDNFNMRANLGPIVHFNFDKCIENSPTSEYYPLEYICNYNFANLGAAFSLGVDIYRFTIDLGYSLGLTKVFYDGIVAADKINVINGKVTQNTLTLTVGYRFGK